MIVSGDKYQIQLNAKQRGYYGIYLGISTVKALICSVRDWIIKNPLKNQGAFSTTIFENTENNNFPTIKIEPACKKLH